MPLRPAAPTASQATADATGKLFASSAARNGAHICALIAQAAPGAGRALELASGTGQHTAAFAQGFPDLHWQPTEIDPARRASIAQYVADSGFANIAPVVELDAAHPGWAAEWAGMDLIVLVNLLHLISMEEVQVLISEAARALAPGGCFVIYGPFMRGGDLTSEGDASFHASLIAHDPQIGYKDDFDIMDLLQEVGLDMADVIEMPANNLGLIARKPQI